MGTDCDLPGLLGLKERRGIVMGVANERGIMTGQTIYVDGGCHAVHAVNKREART